MKQNNKKGWQKVVGIIVLLIGAGLFCLQLGYLYVQSNYQMAYIDHRLFYFINIACMICLLLAILLLLSTTKKFNLISTGITVLFIAAQLIMLSGSNQLVKSVTMLSPDKKHVLAIKEDLQTNEVVYYRPYFGIFARAQERLPASVAGELKVEWLANDIAAVTYQTIGKSNRQFIATYGDRGGRTSYYQVGAQIHGTWQGENVELISDPEGITITTDGETEHFNWENTQQFGTLAIILEKDNEAAWTISLDENFEVTSDMTQYTDENITLYRATMDDNEPVKLQRQSE
ncbi:hypothetical protein [Oceanobacillus neutriphilus]|uniref:Uncharacterized protein n=1 Tax=Oceanobacillus neutriphilus TaxID=531815 RepID=A0ABQ2NW31_9BACI|nr:hypothetical protein [Oceanobacillus neutriphilus]GGP12022.1 hypothetical protein GCM10011346_26360 [Oceanobacillus neutriphilus]